MLIKREHLLPEPIHHSYLISFIYFILIGFILIGCAGTPVSQQEERKEDSINSVSVIAAQYAASKYFDYRKKPLVSVRLAVINSFENEPALEGFLYTIFQNYFNNQNQFKVVPTDTGVFDCTIEYNITKSNQILLNIREPKNNKILYAEIKNYNFDSLFTTPRISNTKNHSGRIVT